MRSLQSWSALVLLVVMITACAARRTSTATSLPESALAGPGTTLPDGLVVAEGSARLGPLLVLATDEAGAPHDWLAILAVDGDPLGVCKAYAGQLARLFPGEGIDPGRAPGCKVDRTDGFICWLAADATEEAGARIEANLMLDSVPGDVTGRYLLTLRMNRTDYPGDLYRGPGKPWSGAEVPQPERPRPVPEIGEPLAPRTTAYEGDGGRYVVLEGSELLAQWGAGSLTGGFDVLLRIAPGADVVKVAEGYARQAAQFEGETSVREVEAQATIVTILVPPGGAGGYQGEVRAVDQPDGDDYIFYSLAND
jgi:hypothetical protein